MSICKRRRKNRVFYCFCFHWLAGIHFQLRWVFVIAKYTHVAYFYFTQIHIEFVGIGWLSQYSFFFSLNFFFVCLFVFLTFLIEHFMYELKIEILNLKTPLERIKLSDSDWFFLSGVTYCIQNLNSQFDVRSRNEFTFEKKNETNQCKFAIHYEWAGMFCTHITTYAFYIKLLLLTVEK